MWARRKPNSFVASHIEEVRHGPFHGRALLPRRSRDPADRGRSESVSVGGRHQRRAWCDLGALVRHRGPQQDVLRLRRAQPGRDPQGRQAQPAAGGQDHRGQRPRSLLLPMRRTAMLRWLMRFAIAGLAVGALSTPAALASNGDDESAVAGVRLATAAYHDLDKAVAAHYGPLLACFDLPGVGGMGQHYVDTSRLDATIDANRLQLVAVEYSVAWSAWVATTPPQLFGKSFTSVTSLHLWALHAWLWRPNPDGMFANYNPNVKLCPGH